MNKFSFWFKVLRHQNRSSPSSLSSDSWTPSSSSPSLDPASRFFSALILARDFSLAHRRQRP
jgi:hypothetical protein